MHRRLGVSGWRGAVTAAALGLAGLIALPAPAYGQAAGDGGTAPGQAAAQPAPRHHSKAKGALAGGTAGALVGGKKGAVAGAAGGALVQHHRNKKAARAARRQQRQSQRQQ